MPESWRFPVFILVSLGMFIAILRFVTRNRPDRPAVTTVLAIAGVVVVGGMLFAKFGQNAGWPWWIYYSVPALLTWVLPPIALRFSRTEFWTYLALAALSSSALHVCFSFLLGWHDYMPFVRIPSLAEFLGQG